MKKTGLFFVALGLGLTIVLGWLSVRGPLERPGMMVHDFFQVSYPAKSSGGVAMIDLNQASIDALAKEDAIYFPYPRALYGEFLEAAKLLGASAVGFDIVFSEPSARGPTDDRAFADAIERVGFPVVVVSPDGDTPPTDALKSAKNLTWGHTKAVAPIDGIFRRLKMDGHTFVSKLVSGDHSGWIHFTEKNNIPQESFYNVLQARLDPSIQAELSSKLTGKIWVLAYTAHGLLDVKPTPLDPISPGAILPAHMISEILSGGRGIQDSGIKWYVMMIVVWFFIWLALRLVIDPHTPTSLLSIALVISIFGPIFTSASLWMNFERWLDPFPITFGLLAGTSLHFVVKVRRDWGDRRKFAKAIQHSMSPQLLKMIENGDVEVRRFGEKREVFVMFSDLVGFTTMSEQLSPEMLVKFMNSYLDGAVNLIISQSGYVDKFIGDAIMAIWGAPIRADGKEQVNADLAITVALKLGDVMEGCRRNWKLEHGQDLSVRVRTGIHFGEAVVGNFGSHDRFNYTALGDTVNLASRLEGVGKYYNQSITVSGDVLSKASPEVASHFLFADEIIVKGKDRGTKIYTESKNISSQHLIIYERGMKAYRSKQWDLAIQHFKSAEEGGLGAAKTLRERCEGLKMGRGTDQFINGVWKLDEK
jgi:adenylate cyclase